ncbi:hypothetical protein [Micromonospora sp. CA-246542]|uniref:hypothetical protein n=1 Tax=Micromonospora sp. CA-246542 TaxID=3239959 RepID=UPI003D8A014A
MTDELPVSADDAVGRILRRAYPHVESTDSVSYISELGDSVQALVYSRLFWPTLVEIGGAVFVALWGDDAQYIAGRLRRPGPNPKREPISWSRFVDSFNVFEVAHIFRQNRGPVDLVKDANRELASILVHAWHARLRASYPERKFSVRFVEADEMMDSRIEVSQEAPPLSPPAGWSSDRRGVFPED